MRILHLVHQYGPESVGGTELYTQTLARHQTRQGHEVAVFFPARQPAGPTAASPLRSEHRDEGVRVYGIAAGERSPRQVFFSTFGEPSLSRAWQAVLAAERPDVVHVQHLMGLPLAVVDHIQTTGIPFVITLHDYWFPCANAQLITNYDQTVCAGPEWWLNCARCALARAGRAEMGWLAPAVAPLLAYRSRQARQVLQRAQRIIAPTDFVRRTYEELGMPGERMIVIPHGIEIPATVEDAQLQRRRLNGALHIAYVGSLAWQKGVHVLIEAVNELPHEGVRLSLYGGLDAFPDYVARLKRAARHPRIDFAGPLSRAELWQTLLQEVDVVVVPSIWYETASLVVQEAFAAKVPVVASRLGALQERVAHERDGLLFPAGDAGALRALLQRLRDEPDLLPRLSANIGPVRRMQEHAADVERVYQDVTA